MALGTCRRRLLFDGQVDEVRERGIGIHVRFHRTRHREPHLVEVPQTRHQVSGTVQSFCPDVFVQRLERIAQLPNGIESYLLPVPTGSVLHHIEHPFQFPEERHSRDNIHELETCPLHGIDQLVQVVVRGDERHGSVLLLHPSSCKVPVAEQKCIVTCLTAKALSNTLYRLFTHATFDHHPLEVPQEHLFFRREVLLPVFRRVLLQESPHLQLNLLSQPRKQCSSPCRKDRETLPYFVKKVNISTLLFLL